MKHFVVIGGGATGLGAAFLLKRAQDAGHEFTWDLYERDNRLGGKVAGEIVNDPETGEPFIIDGGPDCFTSRKPAAMRVARLAGIGDQKLPSNEDFKGTFIWRGGKKHRLPAGFSMFVPTQLEPVFTTELLSEEGKREIFKDLTAPKKVVPEGERNDETLESFIVRRFGREVLDYLAEPFIGGVHASAPETMSMAASFPMYLDLEQKYGSVIRGTVEMMAARTKVAAAQAAKQASQPPVQVVSTATGTTQPAQRQTLFATFSQGLHQLTDAIADAAGREHLHTGISIEEVTRQGTGYLIRTDDGREIFADGIIVTTESYAAAEILKDVAPEMAEAYAGIPNLTSSTCSFAFKTEDITVPTHGFGVLVPAVEQRALLAATYSSTKWINRAPEGRVLVRGFCGTPHNQELMEKSDEELTEIILDELREIMDIRPGAQPLFSRFYRWHLGMSQYAMGHLERVETIERVAAATCGLDVGGGCLRGVGVPNCIESGERAAMKVLSDYQLCYVEEL